MTDDYLQNIFWVLWSLCFLYIYVYGSKACAALHLGHSSHQLLSKHAHRYFFKFFCTQENSFPFPFVLKWCVLILLLHLPFKKLLFRTWMSGFSGCSVPVHITRFLPSASSQPRLKKVLAVFLCFYQVPILYRDIYRRVQGESPPSVQVISSPLRIRRRFTPPFRWKKKKEKPRRDGAEMKAAAHWGAFRDAFLMSEVFLEKKPD